MTRIVSVRYVSAYTLWVRFNDGAEGTIDLGDELYGEIFEPLRDTEEFRKVELSAEFGTVVWPNGADFAPEYIRGRLRSAA